MKTVSLTGENATIVISIEDLGFLQNAINETLEALNDKELRVRTGETRERARALIQEIKAICDAIDEHE
jgi:benzoyl-CoA reductase/2-hydroxyglutaryl-CoA dehydratase subunit BcrC/BadD/HgdB